MHDFDVILRMDWLAAYLASVDDHKKSVSIKILGELEFSFMWSTRVTPSFIVLALQAKQMMTKGCKGYLSMVRDTR